MKKLWNNVFFSFGGNIYQKLGLVVARFFSHAEDLPVSLDPRHEAFTNRNLEPEKRFTMVEISIELDYTQINIDYTPK